VREACRLRTFAELGVVFESGGQRITAGSTRLLRDRGISLTPMEDTLARVRSEGRRPLLIARDRELLGALILEDTPRKDTVRTIRVMDRLGMRCAVLTGHPTEDYVVLAEQCGIKRVLGDVDPEDRRDALDTLRGETIHDVALVTPRLDEPAMKGAEVGIYFKPGENEWIGRAQVLVGTPGLLGLAWLYLITEAARRTHAWGIAWTVLYNLAALTLAMTGWLHPFAAALCANLAWLLLLANANRMRHFDPDKAVAAALERRPPYQP
jgi:Cu+-exporting ATPase